MQHYEVCWTPLLDITQSLRVACSFAYYKNRGKNCYVFVLGLPYITNRISYNSEHEVVNIRLLSICPPEALRPYYQEGYTTGTLDIENEFDSKEILDFNRRLIAKFKLPPISQFENLNFKYIPDDFLFPENDKLREICNPIKEESKRGFQDGSPGDFIKLWREIEDGLFANLRYEETIISFIDALYYYQSNKIIDKDLFNILDEIRKFRNSLITNLSKPNLGLIKKHISQLEIIKPQLIKLKLLT